MLIVDTKVSESSVHGTGLFANQDIVKGQVIWKFNESSCEVFYFDKFILKCIDLDINSIFNLLHYSYVKNNLIYFISNDAKYINHSPEPNVCFLDWKTEVASRDICKGEEILEDYYKCYDHNDFFMNKEIFNIKSKDALINRLRIIYVNNSNFY